MLHPRWIFGALAIPLATLRAQAPAPADTSAAPQGLCWHALPRPACSSFVLTVVGVTIDPLEGNKPLNADLELGALANVSERDALGGSFFVLLEAHSTAGIAVHYRRWIDARRSLEVAAGLPIKGSPRAGSVYGLVKYSPADWIGIVVRPSVVRGNYGNFIGCGPTGCTFETTTTVRASAGVEVGRAPAVVMAIAGGVAFIVAVLLSGGSN